MPVEHSIETWRAIADFPGYQVSNLGRVRSLDRVLIRSDDVKVQEKGCILALSFSRKGYLKTSLNRGCGQSRERKSCYIHQLVIWGFLGPPSAGKEVNHRSGIKTDNCLENLEYVSRGENAHHAYLLGLKTNLGEANPHAKLTSATVRVCKELYRNGSTQRGIARRFDVSQHAIWCIVNGKTWRHVP